MLLAARGAASPLFGREGPAVRLGRKPEVADAFYKSRQWRSCREAYLKRVGGLCERCAAHGLTVPATQVHHKIRITADNLKDPAVTLNFDNMEALCTTCHQAEHKERRWICDANGNVRIL